MLLVKYQWHSLKIRQFCLETNDGRKIIVHPKSATTAGKGIRGIIPVLMTALGFIVKGKGEAAALNSAAHGDGRKMSRTRAFANISHDALKKEVRRHVVPLLGRGLDEAPQDNKDILEAMQSQKQLVDALGLFYPKIVKMDK